MITLRTLGGIDLRRPDGRELRGVLAQPKRLALLAMLAIEGYAAPVRRDSLLGLFWPDSETDRARGALRQALTFLRRELDADFVAGHGDGDLRIIEAVLACDATGFDRACAEGRHADALELYRGEFLAGLFIPDAAPEFDDWIDRRRTEFRQKALAAATSLIGVYRKKGQLSLAAQLARQATALAPDDEGLQRTLFGLLADAGDRAGAIRAYEAFAASLMRQLGVTPSKETQALLAQIRAGTEVATSRAIDIDRDARKGVAVLTFVNMTGDPAQDFLCHGLTEELLAVLSKLEGIRVARVTGVFGFEGRQVKLERIRERLDFAAVLDGTIWRAGATARISAHLVDADNGMQLWAESYEREWQHVPALQGQLARAIAGGIHVTLTGKRAVLPQRPTADVEAYNLYLKGRFFWTQVTGLFHALEFLNQAVAADPNFALAHAGIADVYNRAGSWETSVLPPWDAVPKAQAAAVRALEIDPHLAEAHAALGYISTHFLYDWHAAELQLCRALTINPDYQHAHHWYSHLLMAEGRVDESLHWSMRALQSDPLDPVISIHLAWHYWLARKYDQVLEQCDRTTELDATGVLKPTFAGLAYIEMGDPSAAINAHREAAARSNVTGLNLAVLGYSYAAGGERKLARAMLKRLREVGAQRGMFGYEMAVIHGALGETDTAFDELGRAYRERSAWISYLNVDPRLDRLRGDPRFGALVQTVGLARFTPHGKTAKVHGTSPT